MKKCKEQNKLQKVTFQLISGGDQKAKSFKFTIKKVIFVQRFLAVINIQDLQD